MLKLGIDPEKLYQTTVISQYGLCCCNMARVSFRLFCKNLEHLRKFFGQMAYRPPLAKHFPYAYVRLHNTVVLHRSLLKDLNQEN